MGVRYVAFRVSHEIKRKSGLLAKEFPNNPPFRTWIALQEWRNNAAPFFLERSKITSSSEDRKELALQVEEIRSGTLRYFHGRKFTLPVDGWLTNPVNGFTYDATKHWTTIPDFHPEFGDIKYVWEKSRFLYLQTIMRFDVANTADSSQWVFEQIESWIDHNPINQGPNYRCSQEISIRLFNWILALYFYKDSDALTQQRFEKILFHLYWQTRHIRSHIHFSRIAVRNNHAITETVALYTIGTLFPFFDEAGEWKSSGKGWFEQEILYQIYPDGTFLQFSTNYHRVAIQLLTWAFAVSDRHSDKFSDGVYQRAYESVRFLATAQDKVAGELPNYGANDGSLFFHWTSSAFRDYRPSLDALHFALTGQNLYAKAYGDREWFGLQSRDRTTFPAIRIADGTHTFSNGGVYIFRRSDLLVWINCVKYKDRPSQADNLHIDVWKGGSNLLWDGGSFGYNAPPAHVKFFFGTKSHNTVMLDDHDQMLKGKRFIWFFWSKALSAEWRTGETVEFVGEVRAFRHLGNIVHRRSVTIANTSLKVRDEIQGMSQVKMKQLWHFNPQVADALKFSNEQPELKSTRENVLYSGTYGQSGDSLQIEIESSGNIIETVIELL